MPNPMSYTVISDVMTNSWSRQRGCALASRPYIWTWLHQQHSNFNPIVVYYFVVSSCQLAPLLSSFRPSTINEDTKIGSRRCRVRLPHLGARGIFLIKKCSGLRTAQMSMHRMRIGLDPDSADAIAPRAHGARSRLRGCQGAARA